jgi:hypothetical protein
VAVDSHGNVFFSDGGNNRIRRLLAACCSLLWDPRVPACPLSGSTWMT